MSGVPGCHAETLNFLTHALGLLLAIAASVALMRAVTTQSEDPWRVAAFGLYVATLVALYASSTLSHAFSRPGLRRFFRMADQACIFLLIVGSFTPMAMTYLVHTGWWVLLAGMWALALAGVVYKIIFRYAVNISVWAYLFLGMLPLIAIRTILEQMPVGVLFWFIAGGVVYTIGTLFLARDDRVPWFHALWHLFVITGSVFHYIAVVACVAA